MGPKSNDSITARDRIIEKKGTGRWRQRLEGNTYKLWNAKDCQESPEAGRGLWHGFSIRTSKRNQPCQCQPVREQTSVILNYPVCGTLCYGSSRKLRYPIICLWKSYLNVKVWVLPILFPHLLKMQPCSKLLLPLRSHGKISVPISNYHWVAW